MSRNISDKIKKQLGTNQIQRVNWKHAVILAVGLAITGAIAAPLYYFVNAYRVRNSAVAQAEKARLDKDVDLALRHIDRYLATYPNDVQALDAKGRILCEAPLGPGQVLDAAKALDLLNRLDPNGPDRLKTRRKQAEFYIIYSDDLKRYADSTSDPDVERQESRYTAAASISKQLVDEADAGKYADPAAHRLLAKAYEGQISDIRRRIGSSQGTSKAADNTIKAGEADQLRLAAIEHYRIAIRLDPHDIDSSTRLASLYLTWANDRAAADLVLDQMQQANPDSTEARLVRYRAFSLTGRDDLAKAELDAILKLKPTDIEVRLNFAQVALSQRNSAEARLHLDAIPKDQQDDLRVKVLRGYMEFESQHPDDAIDQWRRGLMLVGGNDQELTWRLAFNLLQLGRYTDAEPLRKQYRRLSGADKNGLSRFLDALFEMGEGHLNEARTKLEKIKDIVGNNYKADVLISLGKCCDMMGEPEAAIVAFRNAAAASPASASPRLAIAHHLQRRHPDQAIEEVDRALAANPDELFLLLESIRLRIVGLAARSPADPKRVAEIQDLFARVEKKNKTNPTLLAYRSEYLTVTGQISEAVALLSQSLKGEDRKQPDLWINLAQGLDRLGRRDEALQAVERASLAENAGDHSRLRIARARLLARSGKGQAALEVLSKNPEGVIAAERPELAQARAELFRELGDRDGAIAAYVEWSRLAPKIPGPALSLLAMAQIDHDERAAKLGLEALKAIGGDREPYGIAARALDLMRIDPTRSGSSQTDRTLEAKKLVLQLRKDYSSFRFGSLLEGMLAENDKNIPDAVKAYRVALNDDIISPALPRLVDIFLRERRFDELAQVRRDLEAEAAARQRPALVTEFDRMATASALKLPEAIRAEYFASQKSDDRRDSIASRASYALLLDQYHETDKAEQSLKSLVKEKPNDPSGWLTLISFQALRRTPADVTRTIDQARREYFGDRQELFLAKCYWLGRDIPKAREAFQKAADARPDDIPTLKTLVDFYDKINEGELMEQVLRKALKLDSGAAWAARMLALRITSRPDPATWPEAWALIAPGAKTSGETPEDRLIRATILARSPDVSRREEAVAAFTRLVKDLPIKSPLAIDTRIKLSQAMIDINRFAEAWDAIKPIADDQASPNQLALSLAVEALAGSNQADEAQVRLDRLKILDPKSPQVAFSAASIALARGKTSEAVLALESAYTGSAQAPNAEAIAMLAVDRIIRLGSESEAALRLARTIAERWPADAWQLARVHAVRKEDEQALAAADVAVEAGSPREGFRFAMAAALNRRKDKEFFAKVAELGAKARKKDPKDYNIPVFLATIFHIQDRYDDEIACYRNALELFPSNVQFLNNMAWTLCEGVNKPSEALDVIKEAIRREGEFPAHLDTLGVIEERLGKFDQAIIDLEKSVKGDPLAATYFHLARVYMKANKPAESRRCRDAALKAKLNTAELDPTDRADVQTVMGTP